MNQEKDKQLKSIKKSFTGKVKQLTQWCEKHLQLNNFKEVKFADNDSDSDDEDSQDEKSVDAGTTTEAIKELKHALRQSKCIIATKFNKVKEKNEGLQQEIVRMQKVKDELMQDFRQVKSGVQ